MAKAKNPDLYVEEMEVWLKQQAALMDSCDRSIRNNNEEIAYLLEANKLKHDRIRLIRRSVADGRKDLAAHKREKARKSK